MVFNDKRWKGLTHLPVTGLLIIFSAINIGLIVASANRYEFLMSSDIWFPVLITTSGITLLHALIDLGVSFCGALKPVYVIAMSSICLVFWLAVLVIGTIMMIYVDQYYWGIVLQMFKIQFALCCYITSIVLSALAHNRVKKTRNDERRQLLEGIQAFNAARAAGCTCGHAPGNPPPPPLQPQMLQVATQPPQMVAIPEEIVPGTAR
ncbi:hypothetical protein EDC01DRAFT_764687 [Geopyxis carbonaria]|nr:hypothetical protein EDC01DRAFT_764687 [Geopyxis carbonaria]